MSTKNPVRLIDLFRYYKGLPHQQAAVQQLGELIPEELLGRDQEWFHVWSQDGKVPDPDWLAPALDIIKEFEGCRLVAYQDAVAVWTIGWGTTRFLDRPVQQGDKITQQQANELLRNDVEIRASKLFELIPRVKEWGGNRAAALISWAYNVGMGAVEESTLAARLNHGADPITTVQEELPRWNKADGKVLEGLKRRREAEVKLFCGDRVPPTPPHQQDAVRGNPLVVPWFSQRDSSTDEARRMCFSSSCAMMLAFMKPSAITGPNGDDQYLRRVKGYGDTTDPKAQLHALNSFGIKASFSQKADFKTIENQINCGVPVPCGYLHRGPVTKPSGGGHWLCVVGYTKTHVIVHDPWGEADLITGDTVSSVARYCHYSRENFGKRWMVDGPGSGWAIIATPCY